MIGSALLNELTEKYFGNKAVNFICSQRLCFKCMKNYIIKHKIKDSEADYVQLLGICRKCIKLGIVYYVDWKEKKK